MRATYNTLSLASPSDHIAQVALCRPEAANALNKQMGRELADLFGKLGKKSSGFRVAVLTGEGKHFCAGADLKERKNVTRKTWQAQHAAFEKALNAIINCPIPIIAAVSGTAMGAGLELALACDFIIASERSTFAFPEAGLGIMPGLGGTQTFPRAIGMRCAKECLFTAKPFTAKDAYRMRLVNTLYPPETLLKEALAMASVIARNAPKSIRTIKKSVNQGITLPLASALRVELTHYKTLLDTNDRHEGVNAFNEKRKPVFTGS